MRFSFFQTHYLSLWVSLHNIFTDSYKCLCLVVNLHIFMFIYISKTMTGIWFPAFLCTTTQKQAGDSFGVPSSSLLTLFSLCTFSIKRDVHTHMHIDFVIRLFVSFSIFFVSCLV